MCVGAQNMAAADRGSWAASRIVAFDQAGRLGDAAGRLAARAASQCRVADGPLTNKFKNVYMHINM